MVTATSTVQQAIPAREMAGPTATAAALTDLHRQRTEIEARVGPPPPAGDPVAAAEWELRRMDATPKLIKLGAAIAQAQREHEDALEAAREELRAAFAAQKRAIAPAVLASARRFAHEMAALRAIEVRESECVGPVDFVSIGNFDARVAEFEGALRAAGLIG